MTKITNLLEYRALCAQPRHVCGRDCPGEYEPEHHCLSARRVEPPVDYVREIAPGLNTDGSVSTEPGDRRPRLPRSRRTYFTLLCVGIAFVYFWLGWLLAKWVN